MTPPAVPGGREARPLKALTICQPYAELIARGLKNVENRDWPTRYRGLLVIHAGKSREWMDDGDLDAYPDMSFGMIVAVAMLYDCIHISKMPATRLHEQHVNGPWCWLLKDVRRVKPIPYRGAQGLWELPGGILAAGLPESQET